MTVPFNGALSRRGVVRERGKIGVGNTEHHASSGCRRRSVCRRETPSAHGSGSRRAAWPAAASAPVRPGPADGMTRSAAAAASSPPRLTSAGSIGSSLAFGGKPGEMLRERVDIVILQVLDERHHRLDPAHAFAHQEQLIQHEEFRLAGERGDVLHARVAVLAMAAAAELDPLGERHALRPVPAPAQKQGGRQPEGQRPPPCRHGHRSTSPSCRDCLASAGGRACGAYEMR